MDKAMMITFSEFAALLAVFAGGTIHVCRKNRRRKLSPFLGIPAANKGQKLRMVVCGVLIATACGLFYWGAEAVRDGRIYVSLSKYNRLGSGFTILRAENPRGFWMAVCGYLYFALLFLYLSLAEIIYAIKCSRSRGQNQAS